MKMNRRSFLRGMAMGGACTFAPSVFLAPEKGNLVPCIYCSAGDMVRIDSTVYVVRRERLVPFFRVEEEVISNAT